MAVISMFGYLGRPSRHLYYLFDYVDRLHLLKISIYLTNHSEFTQDFQKLYSKNPTPLSKFFQDFFKFLEKNS